MNINVKRKKSDMSLLYKQPRAIQIRLHLKNDVETRTQHRVLPSIKPTSFNDVRRLMITNAYVYDWTVLILVLIGLNIKAL